MPCIRGLIFYWDSCVPGAGGKPPRCVRCPSSVQLLGNPIPVTRNAGCFLQFTQLSNITSRSHRFPDLSPCPVLETSSYEIFSLFNDSTKLWLTRTQLIWLLALPIVSRRIPIRAFSSSEDPVRFRPKTMKIAPIVVPSTYFEIFLYPTPWTSSLAKKFNNIYTRLGGRNIVLLKKGYYR